MSWNENYPRMLRRNRATGFAICHLLLKAFRRHRRRRYGIDALDVTQISIALMVSERWVYHVLKKYRLFCLTTKGYYPTEGWEEFERLS